MPSAPPREQHKQPEPVSGAMRAGCGLDECAHRTESRLWVLIEFTLGASVSRGFDLSWNLSTSSLRSKRSSFCLAID